MQRQFSNGRDMDMDMDRDRDIDRDIDRDMVVMIRIEYYYDKNMYIGIRIGIMNMVIIRGICIEIY